MYHIVVYSTINELNLKYYLLDIIITKSCHVETAFV